MLKVPLQHEGDAHLYGLLPDSSSSPSLFSAHSGLEIRIDHTEVEIAIVLRHDRIVDGVIEDDHVGLAPGDVPGEVYPLVRSV